MSGSNAAINDEGQEGGKDSCDGQSFDAKTVIQDRHGSLMVVQVRTLVQSLVNAVSRRCGLGSKPLVLERHYTGKWTEKP
jgi:hypothetical protein